MTEQANYAPPDIEPHGTGPFRRIAGIVWRIAFGLVVPGGVGVLVGWMFQPAIGVLAGFLVALGLFVAGRSLKQARRRRGILLVTYVEQAMRGNLPLSQTLRGWAESEGTRSAVGVALLRTADHLEGGGTVGDALRAGAPALPLRALDRLVVAERNAAFAPAAAHVLHAEAQRPFEDPTHWPAVKLYCIFLLITISGVLWYMAHRVWPKMEQLLHDFKLPMPWITRQVIDATESVIPIVFVFAALLLALSSGRAVSELLDDRVRGGRGLLRSAIDTIRWFTPIIGGLDRDQGLADACRTVAEGVAAHRTLVAAVGDAMQPHINIVLANRIERWHDGLERGQSPGDAARSADLPDLLVSMLGTSRTPPDLVAALQFLSRYYESRFSRVWTLVRQAVVPMFALIGGAVVCSIALAIFLPLTRMMKRVSFPMSMP